MTWVIRRAESKVEESMGDDDYMTKPVGPSEVLTKVETLLAGRNEVSSMGNLRSGLWGQVYQDIARLEAEQNTEV